MPRSLQTRRLLSGFVAALLVWLTSLDCATCLVTEALDAGGCEFSAARQRPSCCVRDSASEAPCAPPASATWGRAPGQEHAPDCPLLATRYGDSATPRHDSAGDLVATDDAAPLVLAASRVAEPVRTPERLPNRGDTYLRCRVLLI